MKCFLNQQKSLKQQTAQIQSNEMSRCGCQVEATEMPPKSKEPTTFDKCCAMLAHPSLTFEFQTEAVKLLVYNYTIVLLIANQDIGWNYPFKDVEIASRYGQELIEPAILSKFGFCFRMLTVILNSLTVCAVMRPKRDVRHILLPPILWNFYTVAAIAENVLEIVWTMYILEVPFRLFATVFIVGIFMIALQSKLTLQVLRFYEYLNYVP